MGILSVGVKNRILDWGPRIQGLGLGLPLTCLVLSSYRGAHFVSTLLGSFTLLTKLT